MCAKDLPPLLFEDGAFRGCEVQPFLFVSALFLWALRGYVRNLQPVPGWEIHTSESAAAALLVASSKGDWSLDVSGVCKPDKGKAGQPPSFTVNQLLLKNHFTVR